MTSTGGLKVVYHHRIASRDGQATHVEEMIGALRELGHEVHECGPSVYRKDSGEKGSAGWVGRVKALLPASVYPWAELAYSVVAYVRLMKCIRRVKADVVYERYALRNVAGIAASRRSGVPLLLEVNAPYAQVERAAGRTASGLWTALEAAVWRRASRVLPVTMVLADLMADVGVERSKMVVIGNGVRTEGFEELPSPADVKCTLGLSERVVIGFTGFVCEWDRLDRVITWMAARQDKTRVHLLVVGDGPVRPELERLAEGLGVRRDVTFTGIVARREVPRIAVAFDVALQTALVPFASPLCLFEYLALGKAIVAPDQPNHLEVLRPGIDAILYQPDDLYGLERSLERVVRDGALRERLGLEARETVRARGFTWRDRATLVESAAREVQSARLTADLMSASGGSA